MPVSVTVGPLVQEGVSLKQAPWDAFYSETASITMMEIVAIYPVNVLLVRFGVKEGMHNPKHRAEHDHDHQTQHASG